ncbi:MAG: tRNA glutamyl-Q(34) synthetase GluQRS [Chloroflexi bacterium]|nr:tRNA glutamyl-Q(34) synthetase GluQRS [Chloroflexota bacterium]
MPRGRFAPSPTGLLHVGGARTALVAWLAARSTGSDIALRFEDLDRPRIVPGSDCAIAEDLAWLGLDDWLGPYYQSERLPLYEQALAGLREQDAIFACRCSRADIARAASAPHGVEDGPRYPGTCRGRTDISASNGSIRFRVNPGDVCFDDAIAGHYCQDVSKACGDFVLRRADGVFAYQLAVVVDDLEMRIRQVVRGEDLLPSTARQMLLTVALGGTCPSYAHLPLLRDAGGERLSKRNKDIAVRDFRESGISPHRVVGWLAGTLGLCEPDAAMAPAELVAGFSFTNLRERPGARALSPAELRLGLQVQ